LRSGIVELRDEGCQTLTSMERHGGRFVAEGHDRDAAAIVPAPSGASKEETMYIRGKIPGHRSTLRWLSKEASLVAPMGDAKCGLASAVSNSYGQGTRRQ
jgi:hypothetical protein